MHVTLRQLEIFNTVARKLSYTKAAEELHLTQPAVSLQIRKLEDALNLPLFEQVGKRIFLTEAGREMLRYSRSISQQLNEAGEMLAQISDLSRGTLAVAVASTASSFATRLIASFLHRYPGATVSLDVSNRETLLRQLRENEKDLVIMGQPPADLELTGEPFMENPLVVIAPASHPLATIGKIPLKNLEQEPFVVREPASGTRAAMERLFKKHGLKPHIQVQIADNESLKEAVSAGLGLGVVSLHTLDLHVQAGRLVVLDVTHFPIRRHWYLVSRQGKRLSPIAQAFKHYVFEQGPVMDSATAGTSLPAH